MWGRRPVEKSARAGLGSGAEPRTATCTHGKREKGSGSREAGAITGQKKQTGSSSWNRVATMRGRGQGSRRQTACRLRNTCVPKAPIRKATSPAGRQPGASRGGVTRAPGSAHQAKPAIPQVARLRTAGGRAENPDPVALFLHSKMTLRESSPEGAQLPP